MSEEAVDSAQKTPLKSKEKPEEDFLGDEKLQVSDSDSESDDLHNNEKCAVHVETTTSMTTLSQMIDNEGGNEVETDKKEIQVESQKAKLSHIIDSESETEADEIVENGKNSASSDDEDLEVQQRKKLLKKKKLKLCLQDSDDDDDNNNKLSKKLSIEDSDSEEENSQISTQNVQQKLAALVDSDSSDENETETEKPQEENKVAPKKPQRASAKKAVEGMMAIQSEQQRLHREAYLNIPYHKPKKYTLQEFLNRRTISSPGTAAAKVLSKKSPKMTAEELEAYAKFLEEREREAIEFFKPEKVEEIENETSVEAENVPKTELEMPEQSSQVNEIDEVNVEEQLLTSDKPIVTEVLELPSLDLELLKKYCNVSPPANENEHTPVTVREAKTWAKIENIKKILADKQLTESPTIKGTPDMLIDLESGNIVPKQPTGVDKLLERLIATRKARNCNTTNKTFSILPEENDKKTQKPGASLLKLKESLKSIISNKRLENLKKKQRNEMEVSQDDDFTNEQDLEYDEEYEPSSKPKKSVQIEIDEEENAIFIEDECMEENEEEEEEDNKEEEEEVEDHEEEEKEEENEEEDNKEEEENEEDNKEEEEEDNKEEEKENEITTKKRIIKPFLNDSDDEDLLKTQVPENKSANTSLMDISLNWGTTNNSAIISQIPTTQPLQNMQEHEEELLELCSGTFENTCATTETQQRQPTPDKSQYIRQILSSDEEPEHEEITGKRVKKLRKKRTLALSDEDDETDESANEEEEEAEGGDVDVAEEEGETYVDYDSEENEVIVKVTKDELRNKIQDFVENEAELSESEWGSADEDEKNMDKYDIELGDEDQFDKDKLKDELEQIHARKMLDEDIRQVRKIQELLFDTDEADGAGRQRQFKWKNTESGFSLDDSQREEDADKNADSEDDDDYEKNWRKLRFEREQMLQKQSVSTTQNTDLENVLKTCKLIHQQRGSTTPKPALNNANAGGFLISNVHTTARASFLERDKELLSKIAGIKRSSNTVIIDDDTEEAITTISTSSKSKNFLFATITAEEHENIKRKADQLLHENDLHESLALKKRVKMDMQKNACFIDQLL